MISVVVTFRNEIENLHELVDRLKKTFNKLNLEYEIIFVDDYSNDGSDDFIKKLIIENKKIKLIRLSRNFGNGPSLMCGFKKASGNYIVYLDCDLQDPPEVIEEMYHAILETNADIVNTKRIKRKGEFILKKISTSFAYKIINLFMKNKIIENAGDFKMYSKRALKQIIEINDQDPFTRGFPNLIGFKQLTINYVRDVRSKGSTHYSLFKSSNPYKELLRGIVSNSYFPLYLILMLSFVFFTFTLFYILISGIDVNGMIFIFFTIIQFSLGFIGIYIKRVLDQNISNNMPIIDYQIGFDE